MQYQTLLFQTLNKDAARNDVAPLPVDAEQNECGFFLKENPGGVVVLISKHLARLAREATNNM